MYRVPVIISTPASALRSVPPVMVTSPCTTAPPPSQLIGVPNLHSPLKQLSVPSHKFELEHSAFESQRIPVIKSAGLIGVSQPFSAAPSASIKPAVQLKTRQAPCEQVLNALSSRQ